MIFFAVLFAIVCGVTVARGLDMLDPAPVEFGVGERLKAWEAHERSRLHGSCAVEAVACAPVARTS